MADAIDRTDCPAIEELAVAWHEAGHAVGAGLTSPGLFIETVTIVPEGDYRGRCTCEDWHDNLIPDVDDADFEDWSDDLVPDEDSGEIGEHERQYRDAEDIVSSLGAVAEGMLRNGRADQPVMAGTGSDQATSGPTQPPFWRSTSSARPALPRTARS